MMDVTGYDLQLYSGDKKVFTSKSSNTVFYNEFNAQSFRLRWRFFDHGTVVINPTEWTDAGAYRVEIYERSTGRRVGNHTVQLIFEGKSLHLASYALLDLTCRKAHSTADH